MARQDPEQEFDELPVPDYSTIAGLRRTRFDELADEMIELQERASEIDARIKEVRGDLATLLIKAQVKSVGFKGRKVTRKDGMSSSISKELLVKTAKLSMAMIEKCTIRRPWTTVVISKPKDQDEGEE